jgi:hypothetical protein
MAVVLVVLVVLVVHTVIIVVLVVLVVLVVVLVDIAVLVGLVADINGLDVHSFKMVVVAVVVAAVAVHGIGAPLRQEVAVLAYLDKEPMELAVLAPTPVASLLQVVLGDLAAAMAVVLVALLATRHRLDQVITEEEAQVFTSVPLVE